MLRSLRRRHISASIAAGTTLFALVACGRVTNLGDGWQFWTDNLGYHFLVYDDGNNTVVAVCPHITRLKRSRQSILGYSTTPSENIVTIFKECEKVDHGYFIVTKETAEVEFGLAEDEFLDRCTELGIDVCQKIVE